MNSSYYAKREGSIYQKSDTIPRQGSVLSTGLVEPAIGKSRPVSDITLDNDEEPIVSDELNTSTLWLVRIRGLLKFIYFPSLSREYPALSRNCENYYIDP